MLFGSPNSANISFELMPWCTFIIFFVVNDEGKADKGLVAHDDNDKVATKSNDTKETICILIVPLFV